jgi:hypothetical protein
MAAAAVRGMFVTGPCVFVAPRLSHDKILDSALPAPQY